MQTFCHFIVLLFKIYWSLFSYLDPEAIIIIISVILVDAIACANIFHCSGAFTYVWVMKLYGIITNYIMQKEKKNEEKNGNQ